MEVNLVDSVTLKFLESLKERLVAKKLTVAAAESCTGGLIAAALTELPGSSVYFLGGVVAYSETAKMQILGVPEELLATDGAVSYRCAEAMAEGVPRKLFADIAFATIGYAGPEVGDEKEKVGTVYCGFCYLKTTKSFRCLFRGNRAEVRGQTVRFVLSALLELLNL